MMKWIIAAGVLFMVYRFFNIDVSRPVLPNLETWYERLSERPAYKEHVMRFFGTTPTEWKELETSSASEGIL